MRIKRLTEEEIAKLPFPDTARAIGGVFELSDNNISQEDVDKLRESFQSLSNTVKVFKTPIVEEYAQCQDCGKRKPDVDETTCPYAEEINEEEVWIVVCDDCRHERAMDI